MDHENLAKIKERIAKLLAMSKDASSPNEAAIAAGRARSMMDKYQLEEYEIDHKIKDEFATVAATHFSRGMPDYMSTLAVAVAKYNDCHGRYEDGWMARDQRDIDNPKRGKRIIFLGYKSDAELAEAMYNRLLEAVRRLAKEYMTSMNSRSTNVLLSFKLGAVTVIIQRINSMIADRDRLTSDVPGTALVVVKKKAVDEHFGVTNYVSTNKKKNIEWEANVAGRAKGATVEISPLVTG